MKNINKQEALQRLASIEKETEELKRIINQKSDWTSIVDFESACEWLGKDANDLFDKWKYANLTLAQIAGLKIETCIEAVNTTDGKRWIPNWKDRNQQKHYLYFEYNASGWVVRFDYCRYYAAVLGFGWFFESKEKALHGSKYFKKYYEVWLG